MNYTTFRYLTDALNAAFLEQEEASSSVENMTRCKERSFVFHETKDSIIADLRCALQCHNCVRMPGADNEALSIGEEVIQLQQQVADAARRVARCRKELPEQLRQHLEEDMRRQRPVGATAASEPSGSAPCVGEPEPSPTSLQEALVCASNRASGLRQRLCSCLERMERVTAASAAGATTTEMPWQGATWSSRLLAEGSSTGGISAPTALQQIGSGGSSK
uniref:Uncharacterized protein n=1 Tax=Tetraselmis sp. GSL018 TaxID=582737 RepID=A0A061RZ41_9CHLO|mmetsp:Transcript_8326/g.19962  ORF Transcript_8326/g.19962 Transcript_8326/m.19962 type:complete len:220 (+) Transcript_8326:194-853(+)